MFFLTDIIKIQINNPDNPDLQYSQHFFLILDDLFKGHLHGLLPGRRPGRQRRQGGNHVLIADLWFPPVQID